MWAVVGLGNPGRRYKETRHNVGFIFLRKLAKEWKVRLRKRIFLSKAVRVRRDEEEILLAMPQTFMNNSGRALKSMLDGSRLQPEHLVVVYDDLDIPLGEIRIRKEGGPGTHKGMISIIEGIQTTQFPRIRIGIGFLSPDQDPVDYVLSPFSKEEKPVLEKSLKNARKALSLILADKTEKAMNLYNQRRRERQDSLSARTAPE